MARLRKMLGSADSPYILSLMRLIETQSNQTIADWCVSYAKENIIPIFEKAYPEDRCLKELLETFEKYRNREIELAGLKKVVASGNQAVKTMEQTPAAQAAAKAVIQAVASIYTPTHSLGLAFYGAAAIAYDRAGLTEKPEVFDAIAAEECKKMELALKAISVPNEKNPAKINWYC